MISTEMAPGGPAAGSRKIARRWPCLPPLPRGNRRIERTRPFASGPVSPDERAAAAAASVSELPGTWAEKERERVKENRRKTYQQREKRRFGAGGSDRRNACRTYRAMKGMTRPLIPIVCLRDDRESNARDDITVRRSAVLGPELPENQQSGRARETSRKNQRAKKVRRVEVGEKRPGVGRWPGPGHRSVTTLTQKEWPCLNGSPLEAFAVLGSLEQRRIAGDLRALRAFVRHGRKENGLSGKSIGRWCGSSVFSLSQPPPGLILVPSGATTVARVNVPVATQLSAFAGV